MRRVLETFRYALSGSILILAGLSMLSMSAQAAGPLIEKLRPCLSKGFNLEADCSTGNYCYALRGGSGDDDFAAKTALAAAKLKEMWGCFESCARGGCFSGVTIEKIEPFESDDDHGSYKSASVGANIVGSADLGAKTHFECNLKAFTSVSMGKSAGASNSVMCSTRR